MSLLLMPSYQLKHVLVVIAASPAAAASAHRYFLVLTQLLHEGKQPDAGCLPHMWVLTAYIFGQDGVEDPGNHVVVFQI